MQIEERTAGDVVILDVRSDAEWEGTNDRGNKRAGHIPGAVHLDPELELSEIGPDPTRGGRHPFPEDTLLYYTNFGPMRIDVATPLNRRPGDGRVARS